MAKPLYFCSIALSVLLAFLMQFHIVASQRLKESKTYYIRHYYGKCLEYDAVRQVFHYGLVCREKFEWQGGGRIIHVPTRNCLAVNATTDGSFLSLSSNCSNTDSLFQYDQGIGVLRHLLSSKCLHPESGVVDPVVTTTVILKTGCNENTSRYFFRKNAHYVIRHFGGLCWVYNASENLIRLNNPLACDRFEYVNDFRLRHVQTGKCVIFSAYHIRLTVDCASTQTIYRPLGNSLLKHGEAQCVHPYNGLIDPPVGNSLVLYDDGCEDIDRLRFYFYDDSDILNVKVLSESCSDISSTDCMTCRGHVVVNGHQYSLSTRGINLVIFDYRSGIYEKRGSYDILEVASARTDLAAVLNSLPPGKILFMAAHDAVELDSNLAEALQKVGVSATFAASPAPSKRMTLAYVGYTGPERKHWEKSVNKIGGTGALTLEVTINSFTDRSGYGDCSDELGLRTWKIPDSRFYAKSYWANDANHRPLFGRLHNTSTAGWCSFLNTPVSEYLQVDLGRVKLVSGVAIQGHSTLSDNVVTKFKVEFSEDGVNWQYHQNDPSSIKEFDGIGATGMQVGETRVNWLRNTKSRFIRVVPTARISLRQNLNCMRIELFGCSIPASSPNVNWSQGPSQYINKYYKGSISAFATIKNNLKVGISTAADNSTLAKNTQQIHFKKVNASITLGNGTGLKETGKFSMVTDDLKMDTSAFTNIDVKEEDCYKFEVDFAGKVLDDKLPTGSRQFVLSLESNDNMVLYATDIHVQRQEPDRSSLQLNVTYEDTNTFVDKSYMNMNLSVSHLAGGSYSKAYGITLTMYYNTQFLQLKSFDFLNTERFSLPPSVNETKPGSVMIQTDTLGLSNTQHFSMVFFVNNPNSIKRGENCVGDIILDFTYENNLKTFNGAVNSTLNKLMPYKCEIDKTKVIRMQSARLQSSEFSIVYDEMNQHLVFCFQRKTYMTRNSAFCFSQDESTSSWKSIPNISAVMAVDVEKRILYGVERLGKSYIISDYPYTVFNQIEDSGWVAVKDQPQLRKSKTAKSVDSLPPYTNSSWTISASGKPIWTVTNRGLHRHTDVGWKRVAGFA